MKIRVRVEEGERVDTREFAPGTVSIGRDVDNVIVVEDGGTSGVSRRHAELKFADGGWRVIDLKSANGILHNGRRVTDASLSDGDTIRLGTRGPQLTISMSSAQGNAAPSASAFGTTTLQPWRGGLLPLSAKGYLPHVLITGLAAVVLWSTDPINSLRVLLLYLTAASVYVVYLLCGKPKPWWVLAAAAVSMAALLAVVFPVIIRPLVALALSLGGCENCESTGGTAITMFFTAALPEELLKITPALLVWYATNTMRRSGVPGPTLSRNGLIEPLDGILIAFAAAAGFTGIEAFQYASRAVLGVKEEALAFYAGYRQAAFRSLFHFFGHGAWSAIFGYYVGLAALRPARAPMLLLQGLAISTAFHTTWNTVDSGPVMMALLFAASYFVLISCIIQARKISPNRPENFATVVVQRSAR